MLIHAKVLTFSPLLGIFCVKGHTIVGLNIVQSQTWHSFRGIWQIFPQVYHFVWQWIIINRDRTLIIQFFIQYLIKANINKTPKNRIRPPAVLASIMLAEFGAASWPIFWSSGSTLESKITFCSKFLYWLFHLAWGIHTGITEWVSNYIYSTRASRMKF